MNNLLSEIAEVIKKVKSEFLMEPKTGVTGYWCKFRKIYTADQAAQEILAKVGEVIPKRKQIKPENTLQQDAINVGHNNCVNEIRQALGLK